MRRIAFIQICIAGLFLFTAVTNQSSAQTTCVLQPPVMKIDFGSSTQLMIPNFSLPGNYQRINDDCPQDGNYCIVSATENCFGHWIALSDHTGDAGGKMLVVNASYQPGLFFTAQIPQLAPNSYYEVAAWLINVCMPRYECTDIRPSLIFVIENEQGKQLARFSTGNIVATGTATWVNYSATFKTPADPGLLTLKIEDNVEGGCGNDFAMDDITIRECVVPKPLVKDIPKTVAKDLAKPARTPLLDVKKPAVTPETPAKKITPVVSTEAVNGTRAVSGPVIKAAPSIPLPEPILNRANPVVKKIETVSSEIEINLYDNGEIDGDTVSIYHNNKMIVSRAGLSEKPITFKFTVDATQPHHELVMVANNLGSIPPNTSLMIITAKGKRYEVFISSSEEKNAKIVIDLKEGP